MSKLAWVLILQGLVALVALYPSLKPIQKTAGRVLVFVVTFALLAASAYLAFQIDKESTAALQAAQQSAKKQWDAIQHNTENPPPVVLPPAKVAPRRAAVSIVGTTGCNSDDLEAGPGSPNQRTFMVGHVSCVNFYYHNTGNAPAEHTKPLAHIYFAAPESEKQVLEQFATYKKSMNAATDGATTMTGETPFWFSAESDEVLTLEQWQALASGTAKAYVVMSVDYRDPTGSHFIHLFQRLKRPAGKLPPQSDGQLVWQVVPDYTDQK